jgi:hypothetical protein
MDAEARRQASDAIDRLDHVLRRGPAVEHSEVQAASNAVIAFRNRAVEKHRAGAVTRGCLDQANAFVSLAYGFEFPLSGLHFDRIRRTRQGLAALLHRACD